jgi:cytosine/adenosine deaminase-related metal-dependent hydrolase
MSGRVKIPPGADEIDLSAATVLPGLIEGHNHMIKIGDHAGADSGGTCRDQTWIGIFPRICHARCRPDWSLSLLTEFDDDGNWSPNRLIRRPAL